MLSPYLPRHYNQGMDKRSGEKKVQNIREMLTMRFRLTHDRALQLRKGKRNFLSSVFDRISGRLGSSELQDSPSLFCLKYVEKLNEQYLLVGNEYQLNAIGLNCMPDYVEASSQWTIAEDDPISNLFVSSKVRLLFVVCQHKLHLYGYVLEACEEPPTKEQTLAFPEPIYGVYVVKRAIVLVLLQSRFEVLEITESQGRTRLVRRKQYPYLPERRDGLEIISIPEQQGNVLQIFFKDTLGTSIFTIYTLRIECLSCQQVSLGTLHKFCEVPQRYISTLQISHYRSDIYLVYVGLQLYAVRNNYFLDSIITNTSKLRSFIKEFNSNYFFLYHKDRFELYRYELNQKTTPERFFVQCLDTIPLTKPQGSFFLDIKQLGDHLVFIFQQPRSSDSSELNFWLAVGDQVPISDKIDKLYPSSPAEVEGAEREALEDRIEMALQMGLSLDTAYLQLWERSGRVSRRDYDLLISTQNYEMIAGEIESKLKKSSLRFVELMEVMERSLAMLEERVRRPQPSPQHIRQLASCHFLLCKYRMFLKVRRASGVAVETMVINIQDYYHLSRIEIVKYLFELLAAFLAERNKTLIILQIRALLTQFSLIFRLKYHEILPNIAKTFRKDLLKLIKAFPELLPREEKGQKSDLQGGVWREVELRNSEDYLILQNLVNFQNRSNIQQFSESKFFKVYQWHSHGAFVDSRAVLQERMQKWTPDALFILFYEQLLTLQFKTEELDQLVAFIETNYPLLPQHLHGRFRFYQALYLSFKTFHSAMRQKFMGTDEFLRLSEDELFQIYFQEERAKKGIFLLKEVEPIYEKKVTGGRQLFLSSMFRFFQGNRSSWADLKIVLNKFNNEKQDFHESNFEVFEVMVRAIMEKVRVGSSKEEAGLDQVVSYLENIPFPLHRTALLQSLISIQEIRQEEPTLRSIAIDMSLRQILQSGEEVIYRMVQSEMGRYKVHEVFQPHEMKLFAYKILPEVNYRKSNLYVDAHHNFAFKCFLIILMQDQRHVPACSLLLHDDFLVKAFGVDGKLIENIVIYLYRKRLSINPVYEENKLYIDAIVNILEETNVKRRFLELSEIYAGMFSSHRYKMKYPFFKTYYPTVDEVESVISELHREELVLIDHEEVFDLIIEFKSLGEDVENIIETKKNRFANHSGEEKLRVMQHELYTAFFLCFMRHGLIKERALAIAAQIMNMDTRYKIYNIIVPVFLIEVAQQELIAQVSDPLAALVSYYFNFQHELQAFVNDLFANREGFTNQQLLEQFTLMQRQKEMEPIFDPNNPVFSVPFRRALQGLSRSQQAERFNHVLQAMWGRVRRCREQFVKVRAYQMMYRLLLHNPYVMAEYINRRKQGINVRSIRALLSLLGMEGFFDLQKVLELGEGIFSILMVELKSKVLLEDLLEMFSSGEKYRDELKHTDEYCADLIKMEAEDLIGNSILSFRGKLAKLAVMDRTAMETEKERKFEHLMSDWEGYFMTYLNYPFEDRDKEYSLPEEDLILPVKHKRDKKLQFQERKERSELCEHLNYFVQPAFREKQEQLQDTLAEFYMKLNKKLTKKHPVRMKSLRQDVPLHTHNRLPHPLDPPFRIPEDRQFDALDVEQQQDVLQVSQSLKLVADHDEEQEEEEEGLNFADNFIDFLPAFKEEAEAQKEPLHHTFLPSAVQQEIEQCLQGKPHFDPNIVPSSLDKQQFLQKTVGEVYILYEYPLFRRIRVIWDMKHALFGKQQWQKPVEEITLRLGSCSLVHSLLTKIEDIFSQAIFLQQFSQEALLQLVRENASEAVQHQQDMAKVAQIVGMAFNSTAARQSVLMMFLIRLCRSYSLTQDQREQNHLKDEIIFIQQSIDHRVVAEAADSYSRARNEDLRSTGRILQFFRGYQSHHGNSNHIRISAIPNDL